MFRTGGSFHRWWASCASGLGRAAIGSGRFLEFQSDEPRHFGKKIGRFVNGVTGVLGDVCIFFGMAGILNMIDLKNKDPLEYST